MTDLQRLLPPSIADDPIMAAAAEAAGSQEQAVRAEIINAYLWSRLDDLPEPVIDHLAWSLHIDGYEYAATLRQKRWLVANFHDLHRYKGTVHGHRLYWRVLLGRRLLAASPPHKSYLGASLTPAERAAFEAPHPEIRIYPFRHAGSKQSKFIGDCLGDPARGWAVFPAQTDALLRIGDRVDLYDPLADTSTPLHTLSRERVETGQVASQVVQVRLPGKAAGVFAGRPLADRPLVDHQAGKRLYTIELKRPYRSEIERRTPMALTPGLRPMTAYYTFGRQPGKARGAYLANRWPDQYPDTGGRAFSGAMFTVKSTAGDRLYKRIKLFDPARVVLHPRQATTFLGAFRLGALPPHHAETAVDASSTRPPRGLHLGGAHVGTHVPYRSDAPARVAQICHVGRLAKRRSDKILVAITNRRPVTAGPGALAGNTRAGDYQLEAY